jgi:uncharacterized protein (DUF427 family)
MTDYPRAITGTGHVEPVPRRIRAMLGGTVVLDTSRALYVWEWPYYPQYYIPVTDVAPAALALSTTRILGDSAADARLAGTARLEWGAMDAWYEEDEEVFVHPRSPYVRVDALRSTRHVRVELDGILLAESRSPVLVFETGLPTRYYLSRTEADLTRLIPSGTRTACPYKGTTSGYWSVRTPGGTHPDLAWAYDFPTRQLLPIAGLIAFYNEKVDLTVDGTPLPRPDTHFS